MEGDKSDSNGGVLCGISIHSLRVEGDDVAENVTNTLTISIHSLRVEGDDVAENVTNTLTISIHSLRVEGDCPRKFSRGGETNFNPLPPRGGRHYAIGIHLFFVLFQSTPSAWRETGLTRPLCVFHVISIHSLRVEGDPGTPTAVLSACVFQSTPSAWRETPIIPSVLLMVCISIHSLRVEGDRQHKSNSARQDISIHSLRVEGDFVTYYSVTPPYVFQSTPSAWRETAAEGYSREHCGNFNPLPPRGGRHQPRL